MSSQSYTVDALGDILEDILILYIRNKDLLLISLKSKQCMKILTFAVSEAN